MPIWHLVAKPQDDAKRGLARALRTSAASHLLLPLGLNQFQHPEFLLGDVRQRDRQPDVLRAQDAEAPPHEAAVRRVHCLFEQVLRAPRPMADVDGFPVRSAGGTAVQLRLRRVAALPAAEDAVGTLFVRPAQRTLMQH